MLGVARAGPLGESQLTSGTTSEAATSDAGPAQAATGRTAPGRGERSRADERDAWAILASVDGIGPVTLGALLRGLGDGRAVVSAAAGPRGAERLVEAAVSEGVRLESAVAARVVAAVEGSAAILAGIARAGLAVVTTEDASYPTRLRAIELPPPVLFVLGEAAVLDLPRSIAVVGTRRPSDGGRRLAGGIAAALAAVDAVVVSGLAVGVDGAAHAAAVAAGGPTVAVLGGGHGRLYPRAHDRLAQAIAARGGAVVSELPPDATPCPGTFPRRNRVISGLADATVVVEAGERSGALITAHWALEQGRGCFLVPGSLGVPQSVGCNRFLREYPGEARLVAGIPELLEDLDLVGQVTARRHAAVASGRCSPSVAAGASPSTVAGVLGPAERQVAAALEPGAVTADALAAASGLPVPTVLAVLTRLEEAGIAVSAFGRYRLADALDRMAAPRSASGRRTSGTRGTGC
ncbi:MAG: Smf protein, processing chain [Chloroflexi bacterium]|nr:Smf protein, processing chain [Chloroflexota bacterium]